MPDGMHLLPRISLPLLEACLLTIKVLHLYPPIMLLRHLYVGLSVFVGMPVCACRLQYFNFGCFPPFEKQILWHT